MEDKSQYRYRYLSRIVIEATTPLAIGSGEKIITDARVAKDVNGLPCIPGTSLAGIFRHALGEHKKESHIWGFQKRNSGRGSEIIFTNANIVDSKGVVVDGFYKKDAFLKRYNDLPIRQHAKLNDKGAAAKTGKFDEEIVYKGSRFCFEMELMMKEKNMKADMTAFNQILSELYKKSFRIGGGTRSGFGEIKVISCKTKLLDLKKDEDMSAYLKKTSSLSESPFWDLAKKFQRTEVSDCDWVTYHLHLQPDSFFLFGSGYGDDDVDMTPVKESYVEWNESNGEFKDDNVLIPATSVKGALSHRVAFYYNQKTGYMADEHDAEDFKEHVGNKNKAVIALFGTEDTEDPDIQRGNVMISDIIQKPTTFKGKMLNHVSIDRFTGGAIDGALFSEKVTDGKDSSYDLHIMVNKKAIKSENVKESFESALDDICNGMLPLGGGVNRGNGVFSGTKIVEE